MTIESNSDAIQVSSHEPHSDLQWLTEAEGLRWLAEASDGSWDNLSRLSRLRRHISPNRARLICQTVDLRERAQSKFTHAAGMFFTAKGLEQATPHVVAAYKARRFAGRQDIVDVGCGIGGDLLELGRMGEVQGIECDTVTAWFAAANARQLARRSVTVMPRRAVDSDFTVAQAWHADPDRRATGRKSLSWTHLSPDLSQLSAWHRQCSACGIKLSPALTPNSLEWPDAEWEWIGWGHACNQLMAWRGALAQSPGRRVATVVDARGRPFQVVSADRSDHDPPPPTVRLATAREGWLVEPHAAILASHLTDAWVRQNGGFRLAGEELYVWQNAPAAEPLARSYRILDVLPFDRRRIRAWLQAPGHTLCEVKGRGADRNANELARELRHAYSPDGASLIVCRSPDGTRAVFAQREVAPTCGSTRSH